MKNILKNRVLLGLICIVLAVAVCFGLTPLYNNALTAQVEIVRVAKDILAGDQITKDMLTTVSVGAYNLPENVAYRMEDVLGKYANADLDQGDYILSTKLSDTPILKNEYLRKLDGSNVALSISIQTFAKGLSGKLERGDIVTLIATDVGDKRETVMYPELQYMEVIAVTTKKGQDGEAQTVQNDPDAEDEDLPSTITLLATPEQAALLAQLEENSGIHAALVYRGDSAKAQEYLDKQAEYLKSKEQEEDENTDRAQAPAPESGAAPDAGTAAPAPETDGAAQEKS